MSHHVSILGLGLLGRPVARRLAAAGVDARGWNRSRLGPELAEGIPLCADLDEAAEAEISILLVSDSDAVDALLGQLEPKLRPGRLVVDMGTSEPARSIAHAERLAGKGIGWVDAPVSGGPEGATAGTLAIMAGGTESDVEWALPVLSPLGNVVRVGGPGAGHTAKLVNQLICGLAIEAVAEGLTLAERAGLEPARVQEALTGGFADSKILHIHGSRMIARDYAPRGKARTQLKDLRLARGLARSLGLELPHLESATALYEVLVALGDGDLDHSAVHKLRWPR